MKASIKSNCQYSYKKLENGKRLLTLTMGVLTQDFVVGTLGVPTTNKISPLFLDFEGTGELETFPSFPENKI